MSNTTYIFIDESGKPEIYSSKGVNLVETGHASKFLVLVAIRASDQLQLQKDVQAFKMSLLLDVSLQHLFSTSYSLDAFHATKDFPAIQMKMLDFISTLNIKIDAIVVEKLKCFPGLRENPERLYGVMSGQLLKNLAHQTEKTEIVFSRKDSKLKLRQQLETEVERIRLDFIEKHPNLITDFTLSYQHNPHYTHAGLQIADYIAHALFKYFEQGNPTLLEKILPKIGKIHDICNKKYFTKVNPLRLSTKGGSTDSVRIIQ